MWYMKYLQCFILGLPGQLFSKYRLMFRKSSKNYLETIAYKLINSKIILRKMKDVSQAAKMSKESNRQ